MAFGAVTSGFVVNVLELVDGIAEAGEIASEFISIKQEMETNNSSIEAFRQRLEEQRIESEKIEEARKNLERQFEDVKTSSSEASSLASEAKEVANSQNKKIEDLGEGLSDQLKNQAFSYDEKLLEQEKRLGTGFDEKLTIEVNKRLKMEANIQSALNTAELAKLEAKEAKTLGQAAKNLASEAVDVGGQALKKAGSALGSALDAFDKVSNILGLLSDLAIAAKLAQLDGAVKDINERLSEFYGELSGEIAFALEGILSNDIDIESLGDELMGLADILGEVRLQNNTIIRNTDETKTKVDTVRRDVVQVNENVLSVNDNVTEVKNNTSTTIEQNREIIGQNKKTIDLSKDTNAKAQEIPQIESKVTSKIKPEVCKAMNSKCWPGTSSGGADNKEELEALKREVSKVSNKIGQFSFSCKEKIAPANGRIDSVAEGIQKLVCGADGEAWSSQQQKEKLESIDKGLKEVKEAIEDVDANASIPEHWPIRVGADRPQLVVLYGKTLPGNKVGQSRGQVSIPHWNGSTNWKLLPRYKKGNHMGRAILKDNSKIIVYCSSDAEAKRTVNALLKFVKKTMLAGVKRFEGEVNMKVKPGKWEPCTADWYKNGQLTKVPKKYDIRGK